MRLLAVPDVFRPAGIDKVSATITGFRAKVDHPISGTDDVQIMFYDHNRMSL
jgi:hypothetical protein